MSLFRDAPRTARSRRPSAGAILLLLALAGVLLLTLLPVPFVIERPGPVYDTLGSAESDGEEIPLIEVDGAQTYPTEGSLDLLTVTVVGNREQRPGWLDVVGAWFRPDAAVLPLDAVFPAGVTSEQRSEQNTALMVNSQQQAIAAALLELGYPVAATVRVAAVAEDGPAFGILEPGDVLLTSAGEPVGDLTAFREAVSASGGGTPFPFAVQRAGETLELEVTPVDGKDGTVVGISAIEEYAFPIAVTVRLDDVGGPSAGMMFALGIIDKLTPGSLTGGLAVAGTGTIDDAGAVGAIGGIRQKMYAARDAGVDLFLAPQANCADVVGNVPAGMEVFAVSTLDEALTVIETTAEGEDTADLARCVAS